MSSEKKTNKASGAGDKGKEKKKGAEQFDDASKLRKDLAAVPKGARKDFSCSMEETYVPRNVEPTWDAFWDHWGLYQPHAFKPNARKFIIVIPPPNVTGTLHLGHALTCSIQDCLVRWHRMCGDEVLWVPGTDHAGIATQVVVEKQLMREEKLTRHDVGREAFVQRVWKWREQNGSRICNQIRRLGASVDWSREAFTMDDNLCEAVKEAFVRMYERGLIYRGNRLVSWSCALRTAISNVEVETQELDGFKELRVPGYEKPVEFGVLHSFAYKFADAELASQQIIVATTRLETMLGDVAVAVHPDDARYKAFVGRKLKHPFIPDRKMVVIADSILVDPKFGTGAVKITPAHDPNDFECGRRHGLPAISILTADGLINENGGPFRGKKRFDVRAELVERLTELKLYHGKQANKMVLGTCQRSGDVVEPILKPQWWVNCQGPAQRALQKQLSGELEILPEFQRDTWQRWLGSIQDWCISRQLWWGHRIPAYLIALDGKLLDDADAKSWVVARSEAEAKKLAVEKYPNVPAERVSVQQDPDVLDTWFSSGLFPFSVMGWPKATADLARFYPGSLLETGHDILFFWVARMVMMGLELTDQLPFSQVFLHALVRDKNGRKMSKSLGNVIDPLDVIEGITLEELQHKLDKGNLDPREVAFAKAQQQKDFPNGIAECGADALRLGLLSYTTSKGADINLDPNVIVALRQFGNKLWNATKFALSSFPADYVPPASDAAVHALVSAGGRLADRWVLSRLASAVEAVNGALGRFEFNVATDAVRNFWLADLCDVYLELIKPVVREGDPTAKKTALDVLYTCLSHGLRLLHPMMPFITEELWHRLPGHPVAHRPQPAADGGPLGTGSIMLAPFPTLTDSVLGSWRSDEVCAAMTVLQEVAHESRSTRAKLRLNATRVTIFVLALNKPEFEIVRKWSSDLCTMAFAKTIVPCSDASQVPKDSVRSVVNASITFYIPLNELTDVSAELVKNENRLDELLKTLAADQKVLDNAKFMERAPEKVRTELLQKVKDAKQEAANLQESVATFHKVLARDAAQNKQYHAAKVAYYEDQLKRAQADVVKVDTEIAQLLAKQKNKQPKSKLETREVLRGEVARLEQLLADWRAKLAALP